MQTVQTTIAGRRAVAGLAVRAAVVGGVRDRSSAAAIPTSRSTGAPEVPTDYRLRHPITIAGNRPHARTLHRLQSRRAQRRRNARKCCRSLRLEARSDRRRRGRAAGRQQQRARRGRGHARDRLDPGRERRAAAKHRRAQTYHAAWAEPGDQSASAIRGSPPQAGPCGLWPEDIGPSFNRDYFENQPPWNYGCATQRNSRRRWSPIPPISCSRAPRRRPTRCAAPRYCRNIPMAQSTATAGAQQHECRQDQRRRQIA